MINQRTIISAMSPRRYQDCYTEIFLDVWFEELNGPVPFSASIFDCERHGKELWIRTMAGEFGEIEIIPENTPFKLRELPAAVIELIEQTFKPDATRTLTHDNHS